MKRLSVIAFVASVAINAGALLGIASGIEESSTPRGQVVVSEIASDTGAVVFAQADATTASL